MFAVLAIEIKRKAPTAHTILYAPPIFSDATDCHLIICIVITISLLGHLIICIVITISPLHKCLHVEIKVLPSSDYFKSPVCS